MACITSQDTSEQCRSARPVGIYGATRDAFLVIDCSAVGAPAWQILLRSGVYYLVPAPKTHGIAALAEIYRLVCQVKGLHAKRALRLIVVILHALKECGGSESEQNILQVLCWRLQLSLACADSKPATGSEEPEVVMGQCCNKSNMGFSWMSSHLDLRYGAAA